MLNPLIIMKTDSDALLCQSITASAIELCREASSMTDFSSQNIYPFKMHIASFGWYDVMYKGEAYFVVVNSASKLLTYI